MALSTVVGVLWPPPPGAGLLYALILLFDLGAVGLGFKALAAGLRLPR